MKQPTLESFCNGAAAILGLESALSGKPVENEWVKKVALWKTGLFRIVVMGEIKKGKSSFINALLGYENLVPVSSDVATSTIFKICYGQNIGYRVFFLAGSEKKPISINASELNDYGTENGNPGNEKQVDFIQVLCPSPLLKAGLVVIDTPGLGGLFKQHKRITYQYVPKADAVFLVTDSVESPIGQAELDLLSDLKKVTKHIFFVQTKSRLVDVDAREARRENNLAILCEQAGFNKDRIHYFVVDSATKILADKEKDLKKLGRSGFDDVSRFVHGYIRQNIHRLLMARAFTEIRPKIDSVARELEMQSVILRTKTEEERTNIVESLRKEQQKLTEWVSSGKRDIIAFTEEELSKIQRIALNSIGRFRPNGVLHQEINARFSEVADTKEVEDILKEIQDNLGNSLSEELFKIQSEMRSACCQLVGKVATRLDVEIQKNEIMLDGISRVSVPNSPVCLNNSTGYEKTQKLYYGGATGASIGGLLGSVIPGIGNLIGSFVGGVIGAYMSEGVANKHEKTSVITQANSHVGSWLQSCHYEMQQQISDLLGQVRRKVNGAVFSVIESAQRDRENRIAELKQVGHKSKEEIATKMVELQKRQKALTQAVAEMQGETPAVIKGI